MALKVEMTDLIHLRVHTAYSLAEGAIKIKDLVKCCKAEGMPAVAITDTANLFGVLEFAMACADSGIQPIIGTQVNVSCPAAKTLATGKLPDPGQLVLIAQTEEGYRNLLHLVSDALLCIAEARYPNQDDRRRVTPRHSFLSFYPKTRQGLL